MVLGEWKPGMNNFIRICAGMTLPLCLSIQTLCAKDYTLESAQEAMAKNDADAAYFLAKSYARGNGVGQDYAKAAEYSLKAAEQGHALAQNDLAAIYARGLGVKQDYEAAAAWYRKAAEQGDALAQYSLGHIYSIGRGVPKD